MVRPGDLLEVERTDDSLIRVGSFGVVNGHFERGRVEVTFNFTTPWLTKSSYVDASGGPVRNVLLSHITRRTGSRMLTFHDLRPRYARPGPDGHKNVQKRVAVYGVRLADRSPSGMRL